MENNNQAAAVFVERISVKPDPAKTFVAWQYQLKPYFTGLHEKMFCQREYPHL